MKKGIIITIATVCVIMAAAAGVFVAVSKGLFHHKEAKGLILYGTEEQLSKDSKLEKADTVYTYQTKVKLIEDNLMIIREKDMQEFCKQQIVNKIDAQNQCEPVSEIESAEKTPVYYAKDPKTGIKVGEKELEVTAGKDYIIGSGRMFDEGYLVVSDTLYEELQGEETGMLVLGLNKAADKEIGQCEFEQVQLIDIQTGTVD
ncbi:MAG: lipoprotein BA_5634 family protein [Hespellia sp.]|nr:lipoprotein BA_5634 family protein [Hespellia sp.]